MAKSRMEKILYFTELLLFCFWVALIIFFKINEDRNIIPIEIVGYAFWFSLGLFFGFKLCQYELRLWFKEQQTKHAANNNEAIKDLK